MRKTIFFLFILLFLVSATFAATYFVSTTTGEDLPTNGTKESPFQTISYALSQVVASVSNPCTFYVAQGTYTENVQVDDYINLYGGFDVVNWFRKPDVYETIIESPLPMSSVVVLGNNIIIDGFTIRNGFSGITTNSSNVTIFNNKIVDNSQYGIRCTNATCQILYNEFDNNSFGGIRDDSSTLFVKGNVIEDCGWGVLIVSSSSTVESNNILSNNTGIYITGESAPTIKNNHISSNYNGIICSSTTAITSVPMIWENTISSSTKEGILLKYFNPEVINNVIIKNEDAIRFENSNATIINNSISNNSKSAIYCYVSSSPIVINNILSDNGVCGVYERTLDSDPYVTYNCFSDNTVGDYYDERDDDIYGHIYNGAVEINTNVNNGSNECDFNIDGPPQYLNLVGDNLHLLISSPCISTADSTNSPSNDRDGVSRPYGAGYDIGAYEYVPQSDVHNFVWSLY